MRKLGALLIAVSFSCASPQQEAPMFEPTAALRVSLAQEGESGVTMTVFNASGSDATFCTYHTAFEGIRNNIFRVSREDEELGYAGKMAKRRPPGPDDYLAVKAGDTVAATVDLRPSWPLTPGTWTVQYRGTSISGLGDSEPIELVVPR